MTTKEEWAAGLDFSKPTPRTDSPNVRFGKGCHMVGTFEFQGESRIAGNVEGEINAHDELIIEESGVVNARIFGKRVKIFGRVKGDIQCEERLELHAGACVTGDLISPILVINEGVTFEGHCVMKNATKGANTKTSRSSVAINRQQPVESSSEEKLIGNTEQ